MVAAAGPLNRFGGGRHLWLATVPVAESPLNGGLSVANEAQPFLFLVHTSLGALQVGHEKRGHIVQVCASVSKLVS